MIINTYDIRASAREHANQITSKLLDLAYSKAQELGQDPDELYKKLLRQYKQTFDNKIDPFLWEEEIC